MLEELIVRFVTLLPGLDPAARWGGMLVYFLRYLILIGGLLVVVTHVMGFVKARLPADRVREVLASGRLRGLEYPGAALFGAVTPFCSCSSIPLFIGFLQAGVPLGVTFSFLITSPLVNEVAVALMLGLFGWKVTAAYAGAGILLGTALGPVFAALDLEDQLEGWVRRLRADAPEGRTLRVHPGGAAPDEPRRARGAVPASAGAAAAGGGPYPGSPSPAARLAAEDEGASGAAMEACCAGVEHGAPSPAADGRRQEEPAGGDGCGCGHLGPAGPDARQGGEASPGASPSSRREVSREAFGVVREVAPYIVAGLAVAAVLHGYLPAEFVERQIARAGPFAVPLAALLGVPLYAGSSAVLPMVEALVTKGIPVGSALAFMMGTTGLSLPEGLLLKKVLRPRLLALFFGVVAAGIVVVGYGLDLLF